MLAERYSLALDAYQHVADLKPLDAQGFSRRGRGGAQGTQARRGAGARRARGRGRWSRPAPAGGSSHDAGPYRAGRVTTRTRRGARPLWSGTPIPQTVLPLYVDARLALRGRQLRRRAADLRARDRRTQEGVQGTQIPDLHYLTGDTLLRSEQYPEAEAQLREELRHYPHNVRASAALATLYQSTDRRDAAARVTSDLVRVTPTSDAYTVAARLWTSLGDRKQAAAVRAEATAGVLQPATSLTTKTQEHEERTKKSVDTTSS